MINCRERSQFWDNIIILLQVSKWLPVNRVCITLRTESPSIILDSTGRGRNLCRHPRSSSTIHIFKVLCDVNQTVTVASTVFVSKCKCQRERTGSFSPFLICVSSGFESSLGTISPLESKLAMFQYKEVKKTYS